MIGRRHFASTRSNFAPPLVVCALVSACAFVVTPPVVARGGKISPEMLQELLAARIACDKANEALFSDMKSICEEVALLARKEHRSPSQETLARVQPRLARLLEPNLYRSQPILVREITGEFKDHPAQLIIVKDETLTDGQISQFRKLPPNAWRAGPGSVALIYNDVDRFLVWGAGLDGLPLRDEQGKVRLISVSVTRN